VKTSKTCINQKQNPMKKRLLRLVFATGALLTLMTACEYEFIVPTPPPTPPPAGDTISFSQDVQPVFNAHCASCHPSVYKPDLTSGKSYNALMTGNYVVANDPANSKLYTKCNTGGSMATYMSAENLNLVYRWIYAGAKND
jgi:hypothetical protein